MSLDALFRLSAYGLIGSGFAALAVAGGLDPLWLVLYLAAFVGSWYVDPKQVLRRFPKASSWALSVYFLFFGVDLLLVSNDFLMATLHLVLFVSALKLFTLKSDRDYVFLFLISFAQLVAASTLSLSVSFLLTLTLFLFTSVATLILFEIRRSLANSPRTMQIHPTGARTGFTLDITQRFQVPTFMGTALSLTLLILVVALPIFFFLPRFQYSFLGRGAGQGELLSGFSDYVMLGEIGTIKKNNAVVMRVKLNLPRDKHPPDMKWRGKALDTYDGKVWSQSVPRNIPLSRAPGRSYFEISNDPYQGRSIQQTYFLQPINTTVLFALKRPTALSLELPDRQQTLFRDRADSLSRGRHTTHKLLYVVWSDYYVPPSEVLRAAPAPLPTNSPTVRAYFDTPVVDGRIRTLAETVTQGSTNSYDKAKRLETFLKSQYGYSLEMPPPRDPDPLADFLFERREGHCEYFASAMVVMLRSLGIPSRLVNGFRAGEYNEFGGDYIVRQSDAHTWVEVFFPGSSWVEFDPTPPDPSVMRQPWLAWAAKVLDAVQLYWEEHFVRYNLLRQIRLFSQVRSVLIRAAVETGRNAQQLKHAVEGWFMNWETALGSPGSWRLVIGAGTILAILTGVYRFRRRLRMVIRRLGGSGPRYYDAAVLDFYRSMLEILKKRGYEKPGSITPREFAESLRNLEIFESVSALTDIYYKVRFRGDHATQTHLDEIRQLLGRVKGAATVSENA